MLRTLSRSISSALMAGLLLGPSSFAFDTPLSDTAVRQAYFLGQRNDEKTVEFLEKYRRHLSAPQAGPWVSTVEFLTPYAETIELSRQRSFGYSAQSATKDYRKRGNLVRVTITLEFTTTYGQFIEQEINQRSGPTRGLKSRSPNFWQDFTYRLVDRDAVVEPLEKHGHATYRQRAEMTGASILLIYDAQRISSLADPEVVVDTPDGQHIVVPFDLDNLR